ncbi:MAG: ribosome biogenesis GTPase Der [Bacteroidales bacterium]|nr:ribosome biogenesis GTPase Der [Bacteroidales bacterium]
MPLPVVAIVGRPNVGKSSLLNWLAGRRISIVDPTAGVTRDRVATILEAFDHYFELVDTGGVGIVDTQDLSADVERQIQHAIDSASVVLFVVDIRDGMTPLDQDVATRLRGVNKPVIFVANKADDRKFESYAADFYKLGYGEPILVSAEQKLGKEALYQAIVEHLPADVDNAPPTDADLKIALVGRRNVGKSTFINSLAQADRVIVSEIAGTTRDSIDVRFERDGTAFLAIDTAGVRKRRSLANDIEFYSLHRAERSIRRADVVLQLFDPRLRISRVDKQLAEYILEHHKPAVFVVNKWDLVKNRIPTEKWADYLRQTFPMLDHVPIAFTTALRGKNVFRLLNLTQTLHKQAGKRVKTGDLNRVLRTAMEIKTPPVRMNRVPKLYYAAQVGTHPPTIVMVTNGPDLFDPPYIRYLAKTIREQFPFGEVAFKLLIRSKGEAAARGSSRREPENAAALDILAEPVMAPRSDDTLELPQLAREQPIDPLQPQILDDPLGETTPSEPRDTAPRRKKRIQPDTWDM